MTPKARIGAAIELLAVVEPSLVERFAPPADRAVAEWFRARRYIGSKDRQAIHALVYQVIRARARLDWWIERQAMKLAGQGLVLAPSARSRVITWLMLGDGQGQGQGQGMGRSEIAETFDGERYAPAAPGAGEAGLIEALLQLPAGARAIDHPEQPQWVRLEMPEWVIDRLRPVFGERLRAECAALMAPAQVDLRVNALKGERVPVQALLARDGIRTAPTPYAPMGLRAETRPNFFALASFKDGLVEIQDEGSQVVAALVGAKPGMRVVDFCAGAGGKTLAIAAGMANKGRIVACDVSAPRSEAAAKRLRRGGVSTVERRVLAGESDPWVKRHKAGFDRVLVDAPCSGLGTWRRNPDGKWRLAAQDLAELADLQARILASSCRLVKPGGRLVYATCSLLPEENEGQVQAFLKARPDFALVPIAQVWAETLPGPCPATGTMLLLTPAQHGTDGFFCAVLQREAAAAEAPAPEAA